MTSSVTKLFAACSGGSFFAFPTWYKYLNTGTNCDFKNLHLRVQDLGLIGLALVDIGLRVAGLVAVGFVVWGGIQFITAQGDPGATKKARQTVINALIGLVISLVSVGLVQFIGNKVG